MITKTGESVVGESAGESGKKTGGLKDRLGKISLLKGKAGRILLGLGVGVPALGALYGAGRTVMLSDDQKAELRRRNGLDDDASLSLRNALNGAYGGAKGVIGGAVSGAALIGSGLVTAPAVLLSTIGKETDKYSTAGIETPALYGVGGR